MAAGKTVLEKARQKKRGKAKAPIVDPLKDFARDYSLDASDISIIWGLSSSIQQVQGGAQIDALASLRAKIRPAIEEIRALAGD